MVLRRQKEVGGGRYPAGRIVWGDVTIDYLYGASFLLIRTTQCMLPLGLCQYLEDRYVFSLGPRCFSFAPFPEDAPTPVPLLLFAS